MDTLAPIMDTLPQGKVLDTPENRLSAALACCVQLTTKVRKLGNRLYELEQTLK